MGMFRFSGLTAAILLLGAEVAADYEFMGHDPRAAEARAHSGADLSAASGKETAAPVRLDEEGSTMKEER